MFFKRLKNEDGLAEMSALVIMIVAIGLGAAAILAFNTISGWQKEADAKTQLTEITSTAKKLMSYDGYENITTEMGIKTHIIPTSAQRGGIAVNPWGGDITLAPGSDNRKMYITYTDVPKTGCVAISRYSKGDLWSSVKVNGAEIDGTTASATIACANDLNTVQFETN